MAPHEIISKIREIIGLSASFGGYRKDLPTDPDESRYQELWGEVQKGLSELHERGLDFANPNPHRRLASMWAWIWAEGGSGRERKECPAALYADLISKLQLLESSSSTPRGGVGATGLPLRTHLGERLEQAFANGELVSVVFLDLDGFKAVNDSRGHQEGDRCLDAVVEAMQGVVLGRGQTFRYGGDEFVVLLPNTTLPEAAATAERLRQAVARAGTEFAVTASVGVAEATGEAITDSTSLMAAVDEAVYVSKFTGKNRTTAWPIDPAVRGATNQQRARTKGR